MKKINRLKGMKDYLPYDIKLWDDILYKIKIIVESYGYERIQFPIIENINLFKNSIYNDNNIIKQLYSFKDKNNNIIALRPEGTSICVRFGIENGMFRGQKNKWWYFGPMFRYEKPQLGRYREFYQFGIESFGYNSIGIEIELILLINKIFKKLNINNYLKLEINFIGSIESRNKYKIDLINFFKKNIYILNLNNINTDFNKNPFRILDTKNNNLKNFFLEKAPKIINYLDSNLYNKFNKIINLLNLNNINYIINPLLFRGLDYYNQLVFEWTTNELGSNSTICSGGRYDDLSKKLGVNSSIPSIGLAIGWNRLLLLIKKTVLYNNLNYFNNIYLTLINNNFLEFIIKFSEKIRNLFPKINLFVDYSICNFKNKIKFIKNNNIKIYLIINNNEKIIYKNLYKNIYIIDNENIILNKLNELFL